MVHARRPLGRGGLPLPLPGAGRHEVRVGAYGSSDGRGDARGVDGG